MTISRRIARPLLASMFIAGGLDAIQSPEGKVKAAAAVTDPLKEKVPAIQQDTVTLVKWNGMVQVGAGALLAIGRFRRLAALALIASLIPTTYAGHRFWEEVDDTFSRISDCSVG
jgi:putative oxidoreductase